MKAKLLIILVILLMTAIPLFAVACTSSPSPTASAAALPATGSNVSSPVGPPAASGATIHLVAEKLKFNLSTITVNAGEPVTINFDNRDPTTHNFSVYTDSSATTTIFQGKAKVGTGATVYTFTAPIDPGTYYFRDDGYPDTMNGSFIVQ
jgi:plastocyanin